MIYLKNIREKQTIHIPRTEINSKVVVIKSYDEGYADGIVEGKKLQKLKLTNLTVSENGVYKREDGWNEVEVDVPEIAFETQEKNITVSKDITVVQPDEGYDGLSKVNVNATQYGQTKYNDGAKAQKNKLTNLSVTANGTYERTDGWNKIDVNVPSQTPKLQQKNITLTKDIETVTPSTGYDGLTKVGIDATFYAKTKREEGYNQGYADGKAEGGEVNLVELDETPKFGDGENNIIEYKPSNYNADGFSNVKINVTSVYHSGYNDGYEEGKSNVEDVELIDISDAPKMEQVNPSNILVYTPSKYGADGFSKVSINVTNIYGEGYNAGKADVDEVELVELSVTPEWENRDDSNCVTYHPSIYSADGFSNVVVNISEVYNEGYRQGMTNNPSIGSKIKLSAYGLNFTDKDFEDVISWFDFNGVVNMYKMFYSCEQLTNMPLIDTSSATSMEEMFAYCTNLTSVPQLDTSNVTDMTNMFSGCGSLTTIPLLDTSKVTDMFSMFSDCTNLTSIPKLSTSKVTRMNNMFSDCTSLTTIPLLDTSNVTDMSQMFSYCTSLTSIPSLNTTKVTDMGKMFSSCSSLTSIPLLDTSSVTDMSCMFQLSGIKTVPQLDTSNVTDMNSMFYKCSGLTSVPQLDTSNVTNMYWMFHECTSLTSIPLLDTSKVEKMEYMFGECTKLTTIPQLDTSKVSKMFGMFSDCTSLTFIPSLNARNVTDGDYIFGHTTLNKLTDLGGFNHIKSNLDISLLPNLTYDSCINVLNGLYNFTGTNQTPTSLQGRLKVHQNFLNLVGDQISIATNKGWTITA